MAIRSFICNYITCSLFFGLLSLSTVAQDVNFGGSGLIGENTKNPTSLHFGPDNRLYVSQQDGTVWAYTVERDGAAPGAGTYSVVATEKIDLVKTGVPNHTDDALATTVQTRQVTGIYVAGTAQNPILYVSSSDSLIGGGGSGNDKNLDTNSGVLSKLSWNGSAWSKIDLVRGLPRCEENHATNGMDVFEKDGITYMLLQQGGHANKGAPSNNFAGTPEFLLSGALLVVNLSQLESMPVYTDPRSNTQYVYDLPTLNNPEREDITNSDARFPYPANHPLYNATIDVGDPFGGDDGLNQSFPEVGGPVQIFSAGYRNAYDVVITEDKKIYTFDNGPNTGWGGLPVIHSADGSIKGDESTTSYNPENGDYISNEFNESGSQKHGDPLHYIGTTDDAFGTYYGGHPNPILAFPSRAGVVAYKNIEGTWQKAADYDLADLLPGVSGYFQPSFSITDFPDQPQVGKYLSASINSSEVNVIAIVESSTNGMTEYTSEAFNGALKGSILAAAFNGNIYRYKMAADGVTLLESEVIFGGFGATPLDVIALPDTHIFPGTVWAATYGADNITVFEPSDLVCVTEGSPDYDPQADNDGDGYSNQDEIASGTNYCSGGSTPTDFDSDFISDFTDTDDDNDGIPDLMDVFAIDPNNGLSTNMPIDYPFWNNDPGTGFFGLGFTGLMLDPTFSTDYLTQFDEDNISFGGAAGKASIDLIPIGDAHQTNNSQQYGFQFGVNVDNNSPAFTVHSKIESPFFGIEGNSSVPVKFQSAGIFIGNGDQDNYLKVVLGHGTTTGDGVNGVEVLLESNGSASNARFDVPGLLAGGAVDIYIEVDPASNTAQPFVSMNEGVSTVQLGSPLILPASFLDATDSKGMAVGMISTSYGANGQAFSAIWDFINVTETQTGTLSISGQTATLDFGEFEQNDGVVQINVELKNLSGPSDPAVEVSQINISGADAALFSSNSLMPLHVGAGGKLTFPVTFLPDGSGGLKQATLEVVHSGSNSPLLIPMSASVSETGGAQGPLLRINAAGSAISASDGGPDWLANTQTGAMSTSAYSVNTGNISASGLSFANKHVSIPAYIDAATYAALFTQERWDSPAGAEMSFDIPLVNGDYTVNLYLGNAWSQTNTIGTRVYDVLLEGAVVVDNLDLISAFGHQAGGMLALPVTVTDGELNIGFGHETQNPLINGIEIIGGIAATSPLAIADIPNQASTVGDAIDIAVSATGGDASSNYIYSISGQPDGIDIEPTNGHIFGTVQASALDGGIAHDGVHTVEVTVSQNGTSVSTEFSWSVTAATLSWMDKNESENYTARHECSFVQAGNKFILFGGRESAQTLDVYDYASNTWTTGGSAPIEFNHFQATEYAGLIWVVGAFQTNSYPNEVPATHIYMYNPANEVWIQGSEIPVARRRGGAGVIMHNDKFYLVGGNTQGHNGGYVNWFDEFDPATGEWTVLQDAPHARDHFHAAYANGKLYALGGRLSGGPGGTFAPLIPEVDVFDFASNTWSTLPSTNNIPTPRAAPAVANFDGKIFVMGGEGTENGPAFDVVEVLDPLTQTWSSAPSMNYPRHGTQAIVSGGGIHVLAGSPKKGGGKQKNMEVYGVDQPQGLASVASHLTADQSQIDFTYDQSEGTVDLPIVLNNTGGNVGTVIQSISVSGNNFALVGNYDHHFMKAGDSLIVTVQLTNTASAQNTGVVTVSYDDGQALSIELLGTKNPSASELTYRVNVGGNQISNAELNWLPDTASSPSQYVNASVYNKTSGSIPSGFVNATAYPNTVFSKIRYSQLSPPNHMQWDFPVANGQYQVTLLFAEVWTGATAVGTRIFDVTIENQTVIDNLDITATYGWGVAAAETFTTTVTDGNLDIDFIKIKQNPFVSGIEIVKLN